MAVGYTSDVDKTPATGSSFTYTSFAVSGANPVVLVAIALDSPTATISSVACSAGLSSGTPVEVKTVRNGNTYGSIWALPAPSGTGTITVTLSASVPWQSNAALFSSADQTTPCPTGDAANATGGTNPLSVTCANLTANDASFGLGANAEDADGPNWDQTDTFNNNTTNVNMAAGYRLGTGTSSCTWGIPGTNADALVAVRIAAFSGSAFIAPEQIPILQAVKRASFY